MVYLFENEKILQQAEFKRITTVSYANEQDETSSGYQSGGTESKSLVLTNYRIILLNSSGEDYPGNRLLMKNRPDYMELAYIFYGKDTFIEFLNIIAQKHKQIYNSFPPEKLSSAVGGALKSIKERGYFPYLKVVSGVGYEIEKHRKYNFTYFNNPELGVPKIPIKNEYAIKLLDIMPVVIEQPVIYERAQKKFAAWIARRSNNMVARSAVTRRNILLLKPLKNNDTFGDTFMKTLMGSTQDVQAIFKDSMQCASYYLELFKSVMAS